MIQETDEITRVWLSSPASRVPPAELVLVTDLDGTLAEVVPHPSAPRASTAVHFRNTDMTGEQMLALLRPLLDGARLTALLGRKVVEVHAPKAGKGSALAALVPGEDPGGIVCFGDDENDRSLFEYVNALDIPHMAVGVWSAEAPHDLFERCDLVVPGPEGATAVLREIVECARVSSGR